MRKTLLWRMSNNSGHNSMPIIYNDYPSETILNVSANVW